MLKLEKVVPLVAMLVLIFIVSFLGGAWMAKKNKWPTEQLSEAMTWWERYLVTGTFSPEDQVFVPDYPIPENAVTITKPNHPFAGYVAIMAWNEDDDEYGISLYDEMRKIIHYWPIDYYQYDPDGPRNASDQPHGMAIYPDGSVAIVFDKGDVMAKIDQCGETQWVRKGVYHHLISTEEDGSMWVWEGHLTPISQVQTMVNLDAETGETRSSVSLNTDVIANNDLWNLFGLENGHQFVSMNFLPKARPHDLFHPNDVEPLPQHLADRFPMFETGDLLVSLRRQNMIAVIDRTDGQIKWSKKGPWSAQHDPDFQEDGTISVYNNRDADGSSSILSVDPISNEVKELYTSGNLRFNSRYMGAHEILPNGNLLVVSPREGRVLETDRNGTILFEFVNIVNHKAVGHVQNVQWLENSYFDVAPVCN